MIAVLFSMSQGPEVAVLSGSTLLSWRSSLPQQASGEQLSEVSQGVIFVQASPSLPQQDLWPQAPGAGEPFSQVSVVPPQPVLFPQVSVFPPQVSAFSLHSRPVGRASFEQLMADLAARKLLPEVLVLRVGRPEDRLVRFRRAEQQLSRLRAMRALHIQPTASRVVVYRSRAALRCLLHGFLPEPEGWVLLEQQSISVEVETSICCK